MEWFDGKEGGCWKVGMVSRYQSTGLWRKAGTVLWLEVRPGPPEPVSL